LACRGGKWRKVCYDGHSEKIKEDIEVTQFPQLNLAEEKGPKATIKTNMGDIIVQLFPEDAPKTVKKLC
jgi:hypothetical protein